MRKIIRELALHVAIVSFTVLLGLLLASVGEPRSVWLYCSILEWC